MISVYLASNNHKRRLQLLEQIGVKAKVIVPSVSEEKNPNEAPWIMSTE